MVFNATFNNISVISWRVFLCDSNKNVYVAKCTTPFCNNLHQVCELYAFLLSPALAKRSEGHRNAGRPTQDPQIEALLAYIVTSPENTYPRGKHGQIKVHRSNACGYSGFFHHYIWSP